MEIYIKFIISILLLFLGVFCAVAPINFLRISRFYTTDSDFNPTKFNVIVIRFLGLLAIIKALETLLY